jgi:hypothetical protein
LGFRAHHWKNNPVIGTDPKTKITEPVSWKTDVLAGRFWAPVAIYIYIYICIRYV